MIGLHTQHIILISKRGSINKRLERIHAIKQKRNRTRTRIGKISKMIGGHMRRNWIVNKERSIVVPLRSRKRM